MKTRLLLLLSLWCFGAQAQTAYYDALFLDQKRDTLRLVKADLQKDKYKRFFDDQDFESYCSPSQFEELMKIVQGEKIFAEKLVSMDSLQLFLKSFELYKKYQDATNDQLQKQRNDLNDFWKESSNHLNTLFENIKCLQSIDPKVISVRTKTKADQNKNHILYYHYSKNNKFAPDNQAEFKESDNSDYYYIHSKADWRTCPAAFDTVKNYLKMRNKSLVVLLKNYKDTLDKLKASSFDNRSKIDALQETMDESRDSNEEEEGVSQSTKTDSRVNGTALKGTGAPSSGLPTLDPTTRIVDATARFLVQRTKEELTLAFFDRFREQLDSMQALRYMLPSTYTLLQHQENIYQIPTMGKVWASAFQDDIRNVFNNFEGFIQVQHPQVAYSNQFKIFGVVTNSFDMLSRGVHPFEMFQNLSARHGQQDTSEISQGLRLINLLSQSLEDSAKKDTWLSSDEIDKLKTLSQRRYFMAFMYKRDPRLFKNIKIKNETLQTWFEENNRFDFVNATLNDMSVFLKDIETNLGKARKEDSKPADYLNYVQSVFDVADIGFKIKYQFTSSDPQKDFFTSAYYQNWRPLGQNTVAAIKAFRRREYGTGFMYATQVIRPIWKEIAKQKIPSKTQVLLDQLKQVDIKKIEQTLKIKGQDLKEGTNKWEKLKKILNETSISNVESKNLVEFEKTTAEITQLNQEIKRLNEQKERYQKNIGEFKAELASSTSSQNAVVTTPSSQSLDSRKVEGTLEKFLFYANFLTEIVTADSTQDLKAIISRYAQPVGSYSIKRKHYFSLDLNAYPGLFAATEVCPGDCGNLQKEAFVNGVTAPIGFSLSWGKKASWLGKYDESLNQGHSFSFFVPVVDIGAAFSYRWSSANDSRGLAPIKFAQIFAPGLFVVWGIKKMPIALMAGAQYTPRLREIVDATNNRVSDSDMIRIGVTASVDISLFNLSRKRYKNEH
jgi:hypothetical protein